jgi:hypothetical protein
MKKVSRPVRSKKPVTGKKALARLAAKSPKPQGGAQVAETVAQLSRATDKLARAADKLAEAAARLVAAAEAQYHSAEMANRPRSLIEGSEPEASESSSQPE